MSKVKITLANGSQVEKPLVSSFKGTSGNYLILDNETNGQMGYPIICISKINGNNVEKIIDQNEWNAVKESLKAIISGTLPEFLAVPAELSGSDDFYTQLTLPVASFDVLKKAYAAPAAEAPVAPAPAPTPEVAPTPEAPAVQAPVVPAAPAPEISPTPEVAPAPSPSDVMPTESTVAPIITAPIIDNTPEAAPTPAAPEAPATAPTSPVEPVQQTQPGGDIQAIKDSFIKSCETMFDALIKQIENK